LKKRGRPKRMMMTFHIDGSLFCIYLFLFSAWCVWTRKNDDEGMVMVFLMMEREFGENNRIHLFYVVL